jgi:hypothetical protein
MSTYWGAQNDPKTRAPPDSEDSKKWRFYFFDSNRVVHQLGLQFSGKKAMIFGTEGSGILTPV